MELAFLDRHKVIKFSLTLLDTEGEDTTDGQAEVCEVYEIYIMFIHICVSHFAQGAVESN